MTSQVESGLYSPYFAVGAGTLEVGAFRLVADLQYLDLSRNLISRLPRDLGIRLSRLQTLNLSANTLTELSAHTFAGADRLSVLDVSHNHIQVSGCLTWW